MLLSLAIKPRNIIQMKYLPIFIHLHGLSCLVVGGGEVALRKTETLLRSEAKVKVVSRSFHPELKTKSEQNVIELIESDFDEDHLHAIDLVIVATDVRDLNRRISEIAKAKRILVNVVDDPELCSFILPAIIDRSPITIAIGTAGTAPVLARMLRAKIETLIPFEYGALAQLASRYRDKVKALVPTGTARKNFWERIFEGPVAEKIFAGQSDAAEQELQALLQTANFSQSERGEVYLVGAGPGDPELLTFRALRLMQRADVVIHDRLVSPEILALVRRDAKRLYVGKETGHHCVPQQQINQVLIDLARQGKRVVRLKGGDPFIFGRGGEEAEALVTAGIEFQVVPGITSASGAACYGGIPLTHRDYAQTVTFTTGHLKNGQIDIDWNSVSQGRHTLVVYMGLNNLSIITHQLIEHGLPQHTPVAVVRHATRKDQSILIGNLRTISEQVALAKITSPAMIIIGEVVRLHEHLAGGKVNDKLQTA